MDEQAQADALFDEIERLMPDECAELDEIMGYGCVSPHVSDGEQLDTSCLEVPAPQFMCAGPVRKTSPPIPIPGRVDPAQILLEHIEAKNVNKFTKSNQHVVTDNDIVDAGADYDDMKCEACDNAASKKLTVHRHQPQRVRIFFCQKCLDHIGPRGIVYVAYTNNLVAMAYRNGNRIRYERF